MGTADLARKTANMTGNGKDPVITDLNMVIATMKMEGKTNSQIANELGVSLPDITYHVKRFHTLTGLKQAGEITDPINNQRGRLLKRLRKTDTVIGKALRDYGKSDRLSVNASNVAIAVNKGLGVLVDKTEVSGQVDLLAQRRDDMRARLDACRQFGLNPPEAGLNPTDELPAIMAEVVEAEKVDVPRETQMEEIVNKAGTPATPPNMQADAPIVSEVQPAPVAPAAPVSSKPAQKPPTKPHRTLSRSKW